MVIQVGQNVIEPTGATFNTHDVLYPDQPGLGVYQTLTLAQARPFRTGAEPLIVGGCIVYSSITVEDVRRWKATAAYRFDSSNAIPLGLFTTEVSVPPSTEKCDASSLYEEWKSQLKLYPK
jgi:hypothetical protein